MKQKYLFDHIEKTGGKALYNVFQSMFGVSYVSDHLVIGYKEGCEEYAAYKMIAGHFRFRFGERFDKDRYHMAMLREPVNRAISLYCYFKNNDSNLTSPDVQVARVFTVEEYFLSHSWKSVKYEEVYLKAYDSLGEARLGLKAYFDFYNYRRRHQGLDRRTPDEVYCSTSPSRVAA